MVARSIALPDRVSRNVINDCSGTSGNGDIGILLGCVAGKRTGNEQSNQNRITNSGAPGNKNLGIVMQERRRAGVTG